MLLVRKWPRMRVRPAADHAPWTPPAIPCDWVLFYFVAVVCFALRMTSTELLVASERREGGRVVACRYFTGTGVAERQRTAAPPAAAAGGAAGRACPLVVTSRR